MRENDIVFFNLHRRYLNYAPNYGGFIGIYALSAFLNHNGYDAQGYSGQLMQGKKILDEICTDQKVNMIGLYCDYDNVTENIFLSHYIKETYGLPVIVGGPQATALKRDFYINSRCDAVVRYEGEMTVLELVQLFLDSYGELSEILGISYWNGERIVCNKDRPVIQNLDMLPIICEEDYLKPELYYNRSLSIMTGRGCPFHCAFCHEGHHTKQTRFRSVENVLKEIKEYMGHFPKRQKFHFLFLDDTFTLKPERVKAICEGLQELQKGRKITWFAEGHIHSLYEYPEMIQYMKNAGCVRIQLGIEAGTQEVLDAYRKGSTLDEIRQVIIRCREAGVAEVYSNIIVGGAHFSRDVFEKDMAFSKELLSLGKGMVELDAVSYWPLPETAITDNSEYYGIKIIDGDFLVTNGDFPQIESGGIDQHTLNNWLSEMHWSIVDHMKAMLKNGDVPMKQIIAWINSGKYKTTGWYNLLGEVPEMAAAAQMLATGEAIQSDGCSDDQLLTLHPMRVISLDNNLKIHKDGTSNILRHILSYLETEVLIYSAGKMSGADILRSLYAKNRNIYSEIDCFSCNFIKTLRKLEAMYLIVFSVY